MTGAAQITGQPYTQNVPVSLGPLEAYGAHFSAKERSYHKWQIESSMRERERERERERALVYASLLAGVEPFTGSLPGATLECA